MRWFDVLSAEHSDNFPTFQTGQNISRKGEIVAAVRFSDLSDLSDQKTCNANNFQNSDLSDRLLTLEEQQALIQHVAKLQNRILILTAKIEGWDDKDWGPMQ